MSRRPSARTAAALAAVPLLFAGAACSSPETPGEPAAETTDPVVLDPGEEQGETLAPQNPNEADNGTDG